MQKNPTSIWRVLTWWYSVQGWCKQKSRGWPNFFFKNLLLLQISHQSERVISRIACTYLILSCSLSSPLPSALSTQSVTTSDSGLVKVTSTLTGLCTTVGPRTYRERTFCSATALISLLSHGFLFSFPLQTAYPLRMSWTGRSQELTYVHIFGHQSSGLNQPSSVAEKEQTTVDYYYYLALTF